MTYHFQKLPQTKDPLINESPRSKYESVKHILAYLAHEAPSPVTALFQHCVFPPARYRASTGLPPPRIEFC